MVTKKKLIDHIELNKLFSNIANIYLVVKLYN